MNLVIHAHTLKSEPLPQPITGRFDERGGTIGRTEGNTLPLPDPDRLISRLQAEVRFNDGAFSIRNVGSANPILVNNRAVPPGDSLILVNGDEIVIGTYAMRVALDAPANDESPDRTVIDGGGLIKSQAAARRYAAALEAAAAARAASPEEAAAPTIFPDLLETPVPTGPTDAPEALSPPEEQNPFEAFELIPQPKAPARVIPPPPPTPEPTADLFNRPLVREDFPSPPSAQVPPTAAEPPPAKKDRPAPTPKPAPASARPPNPATPMPPSSKPAPAVTRETAPTADTASPAIARPRGIMRPPSLLPDTTVPAVRALSQDVSSAENLDGAPAAPPVKRPPLPMMPMPPTQPVERAARPIPQAPVDAASAEVLWNAFCEGADISMEVPQGLNPDLMRIIGELLRHAVDGTLKLVASRTAAKQELQAQVTTLQRRNNNPLKFSSHAGIAIDRLLQPPSGGFMAGPAAFNEVMDDLLGHANGTMAGMHAALAGVLEQFEPDQLESQLGRHGVLDTLVPMNRRAKLWELYLEHYKRIRRDAEDNFHERFGKAFMRAYAEELARLDKNRSAS